MTIAKIFYGTVFPNHSAVLLARVVGEYSEVLKRKELLSGTYSAFQLEPDFPEKRTPIEGHQNVELNLDEVFFNALQTGDSWDADSDGFNFRHIPDISQFPLFAQPGQIYQLEYEFTLLEPKRLPAYVQFRILTR